MRLFVIADSSKRKSKPVGILLWEDDRRCDQGRFSLELAAGVEAADLPLSLEFCARRSGRRASAEESEAWVRSRIVPENRHNIVQVLRANGLMHYDEVALLAASRGRSSDDDYLAYEVPLPSGGGELAELLSDARQVEPRSTDAACARADRIIAALTRQRHGSEVRYAFIGLPAADESAGKRDVNGRQCQQSAAQLVGARVRELRLARGLTQSQLAARAGITQTVLSRVESGKGNPTLALLGEIASALDETLTVSIG